MVGEEEAAAEKEEVQRASLPPLNKRWLQSGDLRKGLI